MVLRQSNGMLTVVKPLALNQEAMLEPLLHGRSISVSCALHSTHCSDSKAGRDT